MRDIARHGATAQVPQPDCLTVAALMKLRPAFESTSNGRQGVAGLTEPEARQFLEFLGRPELKEYRVVNQKTDLDGWSEFAFRIIGPAQNEDVAALNKAYVYSDPMTRIPQLMEGPSIARTVIK